MKKPTDEEIKAAAAVLGSAKSEKKASAARANGAKGGRPRASKKVNQYAFESITGFDPTSEIWVSACAENWRKMSDDELRAEIEAQVEYSCDIKNAQSLLEADRVMKAVKKARDCLNSVKFITTTSSPRAFSSQLEDWRKIWKSL